jgi:histidinol dehydrogenase
MVQRPANYTRNAPLIDLVTNHRRREKGILVYPVYSRRSGGLSVGINLFPGEKSCPFDCPYCEVFPFSTKAVFSLGQMEEDLRLAIASAQGGNVPVKDICFSGNGEPSFSIDFPEALEAAARIRAEMSTSSELVLITNGAGLLQPEIFTLLRDVAPSLDIWLKLDAGTPQWYKKMNLCAIPFDKLTAKIKEFASCAPVTIQTMLCEIEGFAPNEEEALAWETLVIELYAAGKGKGGLRKVQIYGKARPSPDDPKARALPAECLEERAASLRRALAAADANVPVETYP